MTDAIVHLPPRPTSPGLELPLVMPDSLAGAHDRAAEEFRIPSLSDQWKEAVRGWNANVPRMQRSPAHRIADALDELAAALRAMR